MERPNGRDYSHEDHQNGIFARDLEAYIDFLEPNYLEHVENAVTDLVGALLHYNRKEDEDLPRGVIEKLISEGKLNTGRIVEIFQKELEAQFN